MSERLTSVGPRREYRRTANGDLIAGFANHGRFTRAEMIEDFRKSYQRKLEEAQAALALTDEQLVVHTYLGAWAMKDRKEVTE